MFSQGFGGEQSQPFSQQANTNTIIGNQGQTPNYAPTNQQAPNQFYGNVSGMAPAPYQAFGAIPSINPSLIQGGDIGSQLQPYASAVATSMGPQFQQQQDALNSDLSSRGIFNSGAANASTGNLLAQQFGQVLGQSLPYAQQNLQGNQQATNQALAANAGAYGDITQGNMNAYNGWQNNLFGADQNYGNALSGAYLNSFSPQGAGNLIGQGMGQAGQAYGNAYQNAMNNSGPLGSAFQGAFDYFGRNQNVTNQPTDPDSSK